MTRVVCTLLLAAGAVAAQYKAEPAGAPPSEANAAIVATLNKTGTKIAGPNGTYVEIWTRASLPSGFKSSVSLPTIQVGTLLGVLRFSGKGADRRGQTIPAGVYILRYGNFPINGDHQGVAPQRDFLVLSPAAADQSADNVKDFDSLMALSKKASGSTHPAVLSFWKADSDFKPGFEKEGETDWVLQTKIGDQAVAIILIGKAEG
jgi:hypothetical protein